MVQLDDKLGTVRQILLNVPQYAERVIEEAWGSGKSATSLDGKEVTVWLDPATRWRATLVEALGYTHDLDFDMYLPASQLLGDQPETIEALPQPLIGRTVEEVKAAYKADVSVQGKDLMITLPPTEWEPTATRVNLETVNGRVKSVVVSLPWKAHPAAHDGLLDLFAHKWGEPMKLDEEGKPVLVFRDADPRVEVREDTDRGSWRIELK